MKYLEQIEIDFNEWKKNGECKRAVELNNQIGEKYFDTTNPHYFTGNLNSEITLVHLNPKRGINKKGRRQEGWYETCSFSSFEEYLKDYQNFGKTYYDINSKRNHKSPFDHKQIRFLRPFNILNINNKDKYLNLQNVIDDKLQIELIPYGSSDFSYSKVGIKNIAPFVESIIETIGSTKRKYIIFCGRVFKDILNPYVVKQKEYNYNVLKNDGTLYWRDFEIVNIHIKFKEIDFNASIAVDFAVNGYSESRYAKRIKELYGKF